MLAPKHVLGLAFERSSTIEPTLNTVKTALSEVSKKPARKVVDPSLSAITAIKKTGKSPRLLSQSKKSKKVQEFHFEENSYNFAAVANPNFNPSSEIVSVDRQTVAELPAQASFGNGLFFGFAIMVVLLNLICYFLFDDKVFLLYSLALASLMTLLFFSDNLFPYFGIEIGTENYALEAVLILCTTMLAASFAAKYLNLEEVYPRLRYLSFVAFGSSTVLVALSFAIDQPFLAAISNLLAFSVVAAHFGVGMYLFSRKNYPKFYVIAYFIPLLFAFDYFVFRILGIEFLASQPVHLKAALLVEMLLMSYAIVYRMRAIKEENELRQAELRIFLKRQEMMNRQSAMQLMEDVYLENLIMHYDLDGIEIKLLQYISEGKDNAKIARKLKTTEAEVEELTNDLYKKLEIGEQIQQDYRMVESQPDYIYN
jgi:DNA-binding CsgD family transcriptional regulator